MMTKTIKNTFAAVAVAAVAVAGSPSGARAAEGVTPPAQDWSFAGLFGTFDRAAAQRGYQVYKEVCAGCHSLNLIRFRNLAEIGFSEAQVKTLAAEAEVQDGPNDEGEMFTRKGRPSDPLPAPFPNEKAAAAANNGKAPPDLSLITKARGQGGDSLIRVSMKHPTGITLGVDYVYGVLTGYEEAPEDFNMPSGGNYNKYFPGHVIAMPPPLSEDAVEYSDGTKATVAQMAKDVTTFLAWTAEPELEARKRLGIKVMLFLLVLTGMLFALKRKIWSDVDH